MNPSRQDRQFYAVILLVFHLGTVCPGWVTDANKSWTWGIANIDLPIPAGSVPVGATLTIHNIHADPSTADQTLNVHLLNNPAPGLVELAETTPFDPFEGHGARVGTFSELTFSGEDLSINLSQVNDPQSWIWSVFNDSFTQTLGNQSAIVYSSALLELLDFSGSGCSFGFGFHPQGINFSGMTLHLTVQSMTEATNPQSFTFSYGNIHAPQLEPIPDYSISWGQNFSFTVNGSDGDGDVPLLYTADNLPPGASFIGQTFSWSPTETQGGNWSVLFSVSDGTLADSQIVTITVRTSNLPPVLNFTREVTILEKVYLVLPISASDPDGDPVTISAGNLPNGALFDGSVLTWRTFFGDFGTYSIPFTASDGLAEQTQILTLTVLPAKPAKWYK